MKHTRRIQAAAGLIAIALAIAYVARPAGHIPLYDANLVRLAETERQAYCAGQVGWATQFTGSAAEAAACRKMNAQIPDVLDVRDVPTWFCKAIIYAGWSGDVPTCIGILVDNQLWPTYDGALTDQWNRVRPYPLSAISLTGPAQTTNNSRTGAHQGNARDGYPQR